MPDPQDRSSSDFVHHSVSHPPFPSTYCTCATAAASHLPADIANINHLELHFIRCASIFGWSHLDGFLGVLPALAGHTSTVFRCASSFGWSHLNGFLGVLPALAGQWSHLDGFLGLLPALAGHTSTVFLVCFQLPAVVSIDCCDLVV